MKPKYQTILASLGLAMVLGAGCSNNPAADAVCGDGTRDSGEQCDDGNTVSGDGCTAECAVEIPEGCGNGVVDGAEECDDSGESSSCDVDCTLAECGDAIRNVAAAEACDDGNTINGDGCTDDCNLEIPGAICGDNVVDDDETCDEGGEAADCDDDCSAVACGDGNLNESAGEACDDGNTVDDDGCSSSCQLPAMACGISAITCATTVSGLIDDPGATSDIDSYTCLPGADTSGFERIYEWTAEQTGTVNVFNEGSQAIRIVVMEAAPDCSPGACLAAGQAGAQFDAIMGTRYLIIVDTPPGASANFYLGMFCP